MLAQLAIRDIVLIDRLELNFRSGLSVLTGETGAGKSILLDAFALALGGRGDGRLVRHGEAQGVVTAVFDLPVDHPARRIAAEAEIDTEGDLILRRTQMADGRTRAFVNDQPVGVQVLRAIGAALVEIHGQHDDRALADPASHRAILDAFGGLQAQLAKVGAAARAVRAARTELAEQRARVEAARKEADFLRHAVEELAELGAAAGRGGAARRAPQHHAAIREGRARTERGARGRGRPAFRRAAPLGRPAQAGAPRRAAAGPRGSLRDRPGRRAWSPSTRPGRCWTRRWPRRSSTPATWSAWRSGCSPCGPPSRKYDVAADDLAALAERYAGDVAAIDAGEAALAGLEQALAAGRGDLRRGGREAQRRAPPGGQAARRRREGRVAAPQAGARPVHHRDRHATRNRGIRPASTGSSSGRRPIPAPSRAR